MISRNCQRRVKLTLRCPLSSYTFYIDSLAIIYKWQEQNNFVSRVKNIRYFFSNLSLTVVKTFPLFFKPIKALSTFKKDNHKKAAVFKTISLLHFLRIFILRSCLMLLAKLSFFPFKHFYMYLHLCKSIHC